MTDYATNLICATGPEAELCRFETECFGRGESPSDQAFDFRALIPMPGILEQCPGVAYANHALYALGIDWKSAHWLEAGQNLLAGLRQSWMAEEGIGSRQELLDYLARERPQELTAARGMIECLDQTGFPDRREWCEAHWGASSNARLTNIKRRQQGYLEFSFITAWSHPFPVFNALSRRYPALVFDLTVLDAYECAMSGRAESGRVVWEDCDFAAAHLTVWGHLPEEDDDEEAA